MSYNSIVYVNLQAINLAHASLISPEDLHDIFMQRAAVYDNLQQPMMAFQDHLEAAKVCMHKHNKS